MKLSPKQLAAIEAWAALSDEDKAKPLKWITFTSSKEAKEAARELLQVFAKQGPCERCGDHGYVRFSCEPNCPAGECSVGPCPDCGGK